MIGKHLGSLGKPMHPTKPLTTLTPNPTPIHPTTHGTPSWGWNVDLMHALHAHRIFIDYVVENVNKSGVTNGSALSATPWT